MKEIEEANKGRNGVPNKLLRLTTYPQCRLYNDQALELADFPDVLVYFVPSPISADIIQ